MQKITGMKLLLNAKKKKLKTLLAHGPLQDHRLNAAHILDAGVHCL